jgi:hypothetical protein
MVQPYYSPTGNLRDDFYLRYGVYPTPMTDARTGMMNIAQDALQAGKFVGGMMVPQSATDLGLMAAGASMGGPLGLLATPARRMMVGAGMMALDPEEAQAKFGKATSAAQNIYRIGLDVIARKRAAAEGSGAYPVGTKTVEQFYQPGMTEAQLAAKAKAGGHLEPSRGGGLLGAPTGARTADDIEAIRRQSDALAVVGAPYRHWYDDAASAIAEYGGTQDRRQLLGSGMSLMSPNSSPSFATQNTVAMHNAAMLRNDADPTGLSMHAARFLNQYNTPVSVGQATARAGERVADMPIRPAPDSAYGLKTGPYGRSLMGGGAADPRTVNDLWRGRAQGYTGEGVGSFSPAQHNYMWGEGAVAADRARALALGGATDWTPSRYQAAEWVGARFSALKAERDARIAKIQADGSLSDEARKRALSKEMSDAELLASANEPIRETLERQATNVTFEAVPGSGLGHLEDLLNASDARRAEYSAPRLSMFVDPSTGQDVLYQQIGMFQRPSRGAVGQWQAPGSSVIENNPVQVAGPLFSTTGQSAGHQMADFERDAVTGVEMARGLLLGQHGVGTNRFYPVSPRAADVAGTGVRYQGTDVPGAMNALTSQGLDVVDIGGGQVVAGRFAGDMTPRQVQDAAARSGVSTRPGVFTSDYIAPGRDVPGQATADTLRAIPSSIVSALDKQLMPIAERLRVLDAAEQGVGSPSAALQRLRAVIGEGGFEMLKRETYGMTPGKMARYLAARGLPSFVGVALLSGDNEE